MTRKSKKKEIWHISEEKLNQLPPMTNWQYQNEDFNFKKDLKNSVGFLYEIIFPNSQRYIGAHEYNGKTVSYCGSGALAKKYLKKYNDRGIIRIIHKFYDNLESLGDAEKVMIKKRNAVKNHEYLNLSPGGFRKRPFSPLRPVIMVNEKGETLYCPDESQAFSKLDDFIGENANLTNPASFRAWLERSNLGYQKFLKDIYYGDLTPEEMEKFRKKEMKKFSDTMASIAVIFKEKINGDKKRIFSGPSLASDKLKLFLGLDVCRTVITACANGKRLTHEKWEGIEDIYLLKFETENRMHELEYLRQKKRESLEAGTEYTDELRQILSKAQIKKFKNPAERAKISECKKKEIILYFKDGTMKKFRGAEAVAKYLGIKVGIVNSWLCIKSPKNSFHNYNIDYIKHEGRIIKRKTKRTTAKISRFWFKDGTYKDFYGRREIAIFFNITEHLAREWISGRSETWKKMNLNIVKIEYKEKILKGKKSRFWFKDGTYKDFYGRKEIAAFFNVKESIVKDWLGGKSRTFRDFDVNKIEYEGKTLTSQNKTNAKCSRFWFADGTYKDFHGRKEIAEFFNISESVAKNWINGKSKSWKEMDLNIVKIEYEGNTIT